MHTVNIPWTHTVPFGSRVKFTSRFVLQKKLSRSRVSRYQDLGAHLPDGKAPNSNNSPGLWICAEAIFYFWSSTGMFPRPPWHNYFTLGGKHVSAITANFSALFAVHSLTARSFLEGFLPCSHLILGTPLNTHMEESKQTLCFAEQMPFTRWSSEISQGKKWSDETRLLNHSVIPF